jgi:outer membrane protein assembly factor BamB
MNQEIPTHTRRTLRGSLVRALIIGSVVAGYAYVMSDFNFLVPIFGESAKSVGVQIWTLIVVVGSIATLLLHPRVQRRTKRLTLALIALAFAILAGSIRNIGFNGNNVPVLTFRWSPTEETRLASAGLLNNGESDQVLAQLDASILAGPSCPTFLGPAHDGHVPGVTLSVDQISAQPEERWRRPVGGGYAAFAVAGNLAVTIEQRGQNEAVTAYQLDTVKPLWRQAYPALFSEVMGGDGPRATPTIAGNDVFALGATGVLLRIDALTGKIHWKRNVLDDAQGPNIEWGMSGSPLVTDDRVIVNSGGMNDRGVIAYNRADGEVLWAAGDYQAAYASPVLATIADVPQVLILSADHVAGHDLKTGVQLWSEPFVPLNGIAVGQPLALPDGRVFVSASYGAGAKMIRLTRDEKSWSVATVWENKMMRCKFSSPVYEAGFLYGLDDGILVCLDANTGKRTWKNGRYGHGQFLLASGHLYIQAENGDFAIVAADPSRFRELARFKVLPGIKNWNAPTVAGNRLLVRNHFEAALFEWSAPPSTASITP